MARVTIYPKPTVLLSILLASVLAIGDCALGLTGLPKLRSNLENSSGAPVPLSALKFLMAGTSRVPRTPAMGDRPWGVAPFMSSRLF